MNCHHCGKGDDRSQTFCIHCGARVAPACPSCGTIYDLKARFCGTCGITMPGAGCFAVELKGETLIKLLKSFYSCDETYHWLSSLHQTMSPLDPAKLPPKALEAFRSFGSPAMEVWVRDSHFLDWDVISIGEDNRIILNSICFDRLDEDELAFVVAFAAASIEGGFGEYLTARKFFNEASAGRMPVREQSELIALLRDDFILMAQAADARALQVTGNLKSAIFSVIKHSKCSRHFDSSVDVYSELNDRKDIKKVDILAGRNLGKLALLVEGDFEAFSRIKRLESFYKTRDFFLGRSAMKVHPYLNLSKSALVATRNLSMDAAGNLRISTASKVTIIIDRHGNHYTEVKPPVDYFRYDSTRPSAAEQHRAAHSPRPSDLRDHDPSVPTEKAVDEHASNMADFEPEQIVPIEETPGFSVMAPADLDLSSEIDVSMFDGDDFDIDDGLLVRGPDGIYYPRGTDVDGASLEYDSSVDEEESPEDDSELADIDVLRVDEDDEEGDSGSSERAELDEEDEEGEDSGPSVFQDFDVDSLGVAGKGGIASEGALEMGDDGYVPPWEERSLATDSDEAGSSEPLDYAIDDFLDSIDVEADVETVREAGALEEITSIDDYLNSEDDAEELVGFSTGRYGPAADIDSADLEEAPPDEGDSYELLDGGYDEIMDADETETVEPAEEEIAGELIDEAEEGLLGLAGEDSDEFSLDAILDVEEPDAEEPAEDLSVSSDETDLSIPHLELPGETASILSSAREDGETRPTLPSILVVDTGNNRVQAFDEEHNFMFSIGQKGSEPGQFDTPKKLAVDRRGNILVSDFVNCRVQKFDAAGRHALSFGSPGSGPGEFNYPMGLDTDRNCNVYVVDAWNNRVQVFDEDGKFILKFGEYGDKPGQFNSPNAIRIGADGLVYVTDSGNNRVQIFKMDGDFIREFGHFGSGDRPSEFDTPSGLAIDSSGKVYVADTGNNRIQVFDSTGTFIRAFGSWGDEDGCLDTPNGISIDQSGRVLIADTWNHRVQIFDSTGTFIGAIGSYGSGEGFFVYASDVQSPGA